MPRPPSTSAWLAAIAICGAACSSHRAGGVAGDAQPADASPPGEARPVGQLDALCTGQPGKPRVLVYTYENLWRHESNLSARQVIYDMCGTRGFNVSISNDWKVINAPQLSQFDVVVFSVTSGQGLDALGKSDLEAWIRAGGGLVGLHSASATQWDDPFFVQNIGAQFMLHVPGMFPATVRIVPGAHPITDGLPATLQMTDEWYVFQTRPEQVNGMQMLFALDEDTLSADYPAMYKVGYHPIGWAHELYGGRVFYLAAGHNPDDYTDPTFLEIVGRSIEWAAHQR
ncbi:MAG TPA: ThuA domain-containing protein [Kofleriaceae bacterium]|nr:ThuA domain-containing protein [Kofleriaceae bacterium]